MNTTARDRLHAFHAAHPDVENADGEQFLKLPTALLDEHDALLAAICREKTTPVTITIDPAAGIREIKPTFPGIGTGQRFTTGRDAEGRFAGWDAIRMIVTPRGHWYRQDDVRDGLHNDTICRGCGHHGRFDYILDYEPCTAPATAQDVVAALNGPARHVQPGDRVRVSVDGDALEYGKVLGFYRDDTGVELADIQLDSGRAYSQDTESLAAAV